MGQHVFGNLQGIERSAFADLVTRYPEVDGFRVVKILADTADVAVIFFRREQRHRIFHFSRIILDLGTRESIDGFADGINCQFIGRFDIDRFGMAAEDRDADRRSRNGDGVIVEHLVRFVDHLHFFFGVIFFYEFIDLRNEVEGDGIMLGQALAGQDLGLHFFAFEVRFRFIAQFVDTFFAGTG